MGSPRTTLLNYSNLNPSRAPSAHLLRDQPQAL